MRQLEKANVMTQESMRRICLPTVSPTAGLKTAVLAFALFVLGAVNCQAQEWANKMFDTRDHDFGVVARGSDTVFRFDFKNIYKEDVEISSVRSSCGCTTVSIEDRTLKTYGSSAIVAKFNTRTFTGVHSATLTVQIRKPYPAQVQLRVHGNIRGDVVFEPGSVDFDSISQGSNLERNLTITYAGHSNWKIDDVRSVSEHLEAELIERSRNGGRVTYDLLVRLLDTAPPGFLKEQIILVTNDHSNPRIPIDIAGKINAALTVAPQNLTLGNIPQGETVSKRLIVRGKKPFIVTDVESDGSDCFSFKTSDKPATRQMVTISFKADCDTGKVHKPLKITTDLGESYSATCDAYATITPAEEAEEEESATAASTDAPKTASSQH